MRTNQNPDLLTSLLCFWTIALVVVVFSGGISEAAEAEEENADPDDILAMSLEELLKVELDSMAVTGIHHTHERGEWMVGYSFMYMDMHGNRDGTNNMSPGDVLAEPYMVSPTSMDMEMHMFEAMYGITDRLTAMVMVPYIRKSMDHLRMDGVRFTTKSRGIGDVSMMGLYELYREGSQRLIGVMGLSFPTGSISESDNLPGDPAGGSTRLPYPMQLGSGSFELLPGMTYIGQAPGWQWGLHSDGTIRLDENKYDYRLGNAYEVSGWGARKITRWASGSIRLVWDQWLDIHGADSVLNPGMVPTADPNLRAGRRLMVMLGVNVFAEEGRLEGLRGTVEVGIPAYQHLDGPQLETDWSLNFTLEWIF
jgi:hypothetical protein